MQATVYSTLSMPLDVALARPRRAGSRVGAAGLLSALALALAALLAAQTPNWAASAVAFAFEAAVKSALEPAEVFVAGPAAPSTYDPIDGRSRVTRFRAEMEMFAKNDRQAMPAPGGVVFVGSSSVRLWSGLEARFPNANVVKRGFGGSRMSDTAHYADRLVLPYRPRTVIVYAGDNDLAEGAAPEAVLASYADFVRQVRSELPATRIAFISVKPSPSRKEILTAVLRTNQLVAAYSKTVPGLDYIDVYSRMLDADGQPRADLFQADLLHLNASGYAIWNQAVAVHLD